MVINIIGCQPCEGTEAVPPNSRSHSTLFSGMCVGESQVLIITNFGIDELNNNNNGSNSTSNLNSSNSNMK